MKKAYYDNCDYESFWIGREYENGSEQIALKKFLKQIPRGGCIIDIGGGYGRLFKTYQSHFDKHILTDTSSNILKIAKSKIDNRFKVDYVCCEAQDTPNGFYQTALMIRVAHHIPDLYPVLNKISKIVKPQGYFILETANKIHFLALIKAIFKGQKSQLDCLDCLDVRSKNKKNSQTIHFVNHHPKNIENQLEKVNFKIIDCLSVSNFRHPLIKKFTPVPILLFLENIFQKPLSKFYFGPSIFYLCQKNKN